MSVLKTVLEKFITNNFFDALLENDFQPGHNVKNIRKSFYADLIVFSSGPYFDIDSIHIDFFRYDSH